MDHSIHLASLLNPVSAMKRQVEVLSSMRFNVSHTTFSLMFTSLLYLVCNSLNLDKTIKWFHVGEGIDYSGMVAFMLFGLLLFMAVFILLAHRWTIKPTAIVLIILSAIATYFISKYNVAIDTSMVMNSVNTDVTEVSALLSVHMIPYVIFLILVPILLLTRV